LTQTTFYTQKDLDTKKSSSVFQFAPWVFPIGFLAVGIYIVVSYQTFRLGFPLDDAWIHQTYARNFFFYGQWSFILGQSSAGSTAPLWTLLLVPGYLIQGAYYWWTILLGILSISILALLAENIFRRQNANFKIGVPLIGIFLVAEWHLVWAAGSGMETAFFAMMIMLIFYLLSLQNLNHFLIGLLTGLLIWIRPDGITLLGPVIFVQTLIGKPRKEIFKNLATTMIGFLIVFLPYLAFNYSLSGRLLPNTFFAKQAEYAVLLQTPLFRRFFSLFFLPMIGAGVILLPGFLWGIWKMIQKKNWLLISAALWWAGYTMLYVLRLPVIYQHGRYLIPAMPIFFLLGLYGTIDFFQSFSGASRYLRVFGKTAVISLGLVWLIFFGMGANAYAVDVAIIESEMVDAAKWVSDNLDQSALIAAHDIGALGYFGKHDLIDLAGLVNPEVIPFIRKEDQIARYMDEKKVEYLVTFPEWYPELIKRGTLIYQTENHFSSNAGGQNIGVYIWKSN